MEKENIKKVLLTSFVGFWLVVATSLFLVSCGNPLNDFITSGFTEFDHPLEDTAESAMLKFYDLRSSNYFDQNKMHKGDQKAIVRWCGSEPGEAAACVRPHFSAIAFDLEYTEKCRTLVHELLHQLIFEYGKEDLGVDHHSPLFFTQVKKICKDIEGEYSE